MGGAHPDGKKLYVTVGRADKVAVIDTTQNKVVTMIPVGKMPWGVAVSLARELEQAAS